MPFAVSEAVLVRDVLFVLQGIDGQYVRWSESGGCTVGVGYAGAPSPGTQGAYRVSDSVGPGVPLSTRTLISRIGELGWLFRRVCDYVTALDTAAAPGKVAQALGAALQGEIGRYYGDLAVLTSQVDQGLLGGVGTGTLGPVLSPRAAELSARASAILSPPRAGLRCVCVWECVRVRVCVFD